MSLKPPVIVLHPEFCFLYLVTGSFSSLGFSYHLSSVKSPQPLGTVVVLSVPVDLSYCLCRLSGCDSRRGNVGCSLGSLYRHKLHNTTRITSDVLKTTVQRELRLLYSPAFRTSTLLQKSKCPLKGPKTPFSIWVVYIRLKHCYIIRHLICH